VNYVKLELRPLRAHGYQKCFPISASFFLSIFIQCFSYFHPFYYHLCTVNHITGFLFIEQTICWYIFIFHRTQTYHKSEFCPQTLLLFCTLNIFGSSVSREPYKSLGLHCVHLSIILKPVIGRCGSCRLYCSALIGH
jgi:hypothetical protein